MPAIAIMISRYGLTTETVTQTVIVLRIPYVTKIAMPGIIMSTRTVSFENLVTILPIGLESKNTMLDRMTFSLILLCIFLVACNIKHWKMRDLINTNSINPITVPTKMYAKWSAACCSSRGIIVQEAIT